MTGIRHLAGLEELRACAELQRLTWGDVYEDVVPPSLLKVSQKIGGLLAGAFEDDVLVGFVYSLLGYQGGAMVHWSHMLAVHPDARGAGLGRRLKLFQRDELMKKGIDTVFWTFDPLMARNAHLNINRLGASIVGYVPNMYGSDSRSPLHAGGDTDRFIVRWELRSQRARWAVEGDIGTDASGAVTESPIVTAPGEEEDPDDMELPETDAVRVEVPCDLALVAEQDPESLGRWRAMARRAFLTYLRRGYAVQSFHRASAPQRCCYFLRRP